MNHGGYGGELAGRRVGCWLAVPQGNFYQFRVTCRNVLQERTYMKLAYLDPGSGSLIIQAVVGGVAGVLVMFKFGWQRIISRFRKRPVDAEKE